MLSKQYTVSIERLLLNEPNKVRGVEGNRYTSLFRVLRENENLNGRDFCEGEFY